MSDATARERIRNSLDESLVVEAAAGTGKTTELVHRIVNTLKSGKTTVDRIVAVTFTRKAAGELRLRLRIELDAARAASPSANLDNALERLEEAHIGTIHSFCAELLRQRPVEARIPPGFEELDEDQSSRLYSRAFNLWIQLALQRMSTGMRRALYRLADSENPLDQIRDAGRALVEWRDFPKIWRRENFDPREEVDRLLPEVAELAAMALSCKTSSHPVRKHLQSVIDFMARMKRSEELRARDYDGLEASLVQLARKLRDKHNKGDKKFSSKFSRDEVLEAKERLQSNLDAFQRLSDADLAALLQGELQELVDYYEAIKARAGKLDFVDLLIRARNLIRDDSSVRNFMQNQFTHIFVDEFQDTDPVQAEILILLSADDPGVTDWRAVRPKPGKLFLVGDPKQSIYRFRRADILLYQALTHLLRAKGVGIEYLSRSFRAVKPIQEAVNLAFAPEMTADTATGQPAYVALEPVAEALEQPAVVALPVPFPYGARLISNDAIKKCLPSTIAAYAEWLIRESGWKVREPGTGALVPIASQHIAILFRRFMERGNDITRDYVHELEARNVPHLLWGARSFHQREEIETVRAALNAVERPDDELSVYATLRGALFAISDNLLLRYRHQSGSFHPFHRVPAGIDPEFQPVAETLQLIAELHRRRNRRPVVETVNALLEAARAHAAFAMRPSGNQVLLNVHRILDLARAYEQRDGYSFRGFVERLNEHAEHGEEGEGPVLEEGTEGVRIMTVHSAKGLEFPVVILADITAKIAANHPDKHVNVAERLCAARLLGCSPWDLLDHEEEEHQCDLAEGVRVAYVAATRARDLLVVPAVGDAERSGWVSPLNKVIYPSRQDFRESKPAPRCPSFGDVSVLARPLEFDGSSESSVKPGLHENGIVWWDPALLRLQVEASFGLRQEEIFSDDGGASFQQYEEWKNQRQQLLRKGETPSLNVFLATDGVEPPAGYASQVQVEHVTRDGPRPSGSRLGSLVHLTFRDVAFAAKQDAILRIARTHSRLLGATEEEVAASTEAVTAALKHPLLRRAASARRCYRELPITLQDTPGTLLEAVLDLAFLEDDGWVVVDFKTDAEDPSRLIRYRRQVGWYMHALERFSQQPSQGWILHL